MNAANWKPMATYRLQFNQEFRLADAQQLVPYFSRLGITHLYASPLLRARKASTHGYDVVDSKSINPNLGDKTDLIELSADLGKFGLGMILDIVPNHMAASLENPYWRDVLTYGHSSPFAGWFDINWRMPDPEMWGRVLVPVLGEPRARVLEQDQIQLEWSDGRFLVRYFDHVFPVDPSSVPSICSFGWDRLEGCLPSDSPTLAKISAILTKLRKLPKLVTRLRRRTDIDHDETEDHLAQLAQLVVQSPRIQNWAEMTALAFGRGDEGHRRMKKLLDNQPYRLVHWRDAARSINYRRFFDINELISVRQEDPQVFEETHSTVLRWVSDGLVDGLRIDHIDGLRDPLGYLDRLRDSTSAGERTVPVFVEKILARQETLPAGWPTAGTTGYEFLNEVEAVLVSPEGFKVIEEQYRRMLRRPIRFEEVAVWGKRRVLHEDLSPQVGRLADSLVRLAAGRGQASTAAREEAVVALAIGGGGVDDGAVGSLTLAMNAQPTKRDFVHAVTEVVTGLPVYRTYVDSSRSGMQATEREYLEHALRTARDRGRAAPEALDFLSEVLLLQDPDLPEHDVSDRVNFIQRFQQLSGPAAAKGIEDTALYAYVPLVSLNEVGGEPHLPDDPVLALHEANESRLERFPQTMLCVTTHDTKRTADVRARIDVLSELPRLWSSLVRRWRRTNERYCAKVSGKRAPNAAMEYLFYQSLIGIWPAPDPNRPESLPSSDALGEIRDRVEHYMLKAAREAKTHTSWTNNNTGYEEALLSFVRGTLQFDGVNPTPFVSEVQGLVARIALPGFWNSLSRTLIQFTAPGTPDVYQGDELWNLR